MFKSNCSLLCTCIIVYCIAYLTKIKVYHQSPFKLIEQLLGWARRPGKPFAMELRLNLFYQFFCCTWEGSNAAMHCAVWKYCKST